MALGFRLFKVHKGFGFLSGVWIRAHRGHRGQSGLGFGQCFGLRGSVLSWFRGQFSKGRFKKAFQRRKWLVSERGALQKRMDAPSEELPELFSGQQWLVPANS